MKRIARGTLTMISMCSALPVFASTDAPQPDWTTHWLGYAMLVVFVIAYGFVMFEETTHMRKSKPVMLAAGAMWASIAAYFAFHGEPHLVEAAARHHLLDYAELFLFLLAAMTYINALEERLVFVGLRNWLINRGFGYRALFWYTGILAFFISAIADNLTTALVMCAVVVALGKDSPKFVTLSCINLVVAANAGGAFSPFGDITTLMVWQKGMLDFWTFFRLFIPSVVSYLVPAIFIFFALPKGAPASSRKSISVKRGGMGILILFILTITFTVLGHSFWHLPPVFGMMSGLAWLQIYGYFLRNKELKNSNGDTEAEDAVFDIFQKIAKVEWDTLLFFYGVVMCVGALGFLGYLTLLSHGLYGSLGQTTANSIIGVISAIVDNIPVMFAVLNMNLEMSQGQWLLVTLTTGIGGSLLSIGSAAGVALMGQARGIYTFGSHLRWSPAIAAGFLAGILCHLWINSGLF